MYIRLVLTTLLSILVSTSVLSADFSAPLIDLPRVKPPLNLNSRVTIKAIVDDDIGVSSVKLYYRIVDQTGGFKSIALSSTKSGPKSYAVTLPMEVSQLRGIEYYVEARDMANNISQEPFPNNPKKVYFEAKPIKTNKPVANSRYFKTGLLWGANISYGNFSVDDPDGSTGSMNTPSMAAIISYAPNRRWRGWAELGYLKFTSPYSQTKIGQDVTSMHLDFLIQRNFPLQGKATWVGAGIGLENIKTSNRGTELNNTFLVKYDDRSDSTLRFVIDFGYQLMPLSNKTVGLNGKIYRTIDNGLNGFMLGVYISL